MAITLIDKSGKAIGSADVPAVFTLEPNGPLLHQAVMRHLANRRAGTADTKRRDDVAGGGRKPWRQKGTGRARHGSIRSPIWRKGGVVFGPHPRSFAIAMTKKARRKALAMAIAAKATAGELFVIDAAGLKPAKTKDLISLLWGAGRRKKGEKEKVRDDASSVLFVVDRARDEGAREIALSGRNLARATVIGHDQTSVHALLAHDRVFITKHAYEALAEVCGA
jgi:large subunit ribosomal protein L4